MVIDMTKPVFYLAADFNIAAKDAEEASAIIYELQQYVQKQWLIDIFFDFGTLEQIGYMEVTD